MFIRNHEASNIEVLASQAAQEPTTASDIPCFCCAPAHWQCDHNQDHHRALLEMTHQYTSVTDAAVLQAAWSTTRLSSPPRSCCSICSSKHCRTCRSAVSMRQATAVEACKQAPTANQCPGVVPPIWWLCRATVTPMFHLHQDIAASGALAVTVWRQGSGCSLKAVQQ